jgi:uncharacterized membrane protein YccC
MYGEQKKSEGIAGILVGIILGGLVLFYLLVHLAGE